jgi:hypothetical protein
MNCFQLDNSIPQGMDESYILNYPQDNRIRLDK